MPIFQSPGVNASEIDSSAPAVRTPSGVPSCVISPTAKGPAFIPTQVTTLSDYASVFGGINSNTPHGYLTAREWFTNTAVPLVQVRVLGAGDGKTRNADGTVTNAGFVVGSQQPVESSDGILGNNQYANSTGVTGSVYFLGCFMSQSAGSTVFSDAGLQSSTTAVPIVRGVLFAPSGVVIRLSSAAQLSPAPDADFVATETAFSGGFTGSVDLGTGNQTFVLILNGHKGTDSRYPNTVTASFDPQAANYFSSVFNTDPLKTQEAGHLLYGHFDIFSSFAVPTGSGVVVAASGSTYGNKQNIAFVVPGSGSGGVHTSNTGSTITPNYEGFRDRYTTAVSPWVISQGFGGSYSNLFRFHHLSDGESGNMAVKISILNIQPGTATQPYGVFDVLIRDANDRDESGTMKILEAFTNCSLNPSNPNYIGKKIGTTHNRFEFDASEAEQKIQTTGDYPNRSRYVRVEIAADVDAAELDSSAVPFGFRGPQHLVTAGSSSLYNIKHGDLLNPSFPYFDTGLGNVPLYKAVQPPVPMRLNLKKSAASSGVDTNLFWGVQFQNQVTVSDPNGSSTANDSLSGYTKFYPNFDLSSNVQFAVFDNTGVVDTTSSWVLDSDRFNNNLFSLEKVKVVTGSNALPSVTSTALLSWSYVRSGSIPSDEATKTRALAVSDLDGNASVQALAKFSFYLERGFDGVNVFDANTRYMKNAAAAQEIAQATRGLTDGPTVQGYMKSLGLIADVNDVDVQLLSVPGIRVPYITDNAISTVEQSRFDCFYVMDPEQYDTLGNNITGSYSDVSVTQTALNFVTRGVNSSFAATYFPDVNIRMDNGVVYEKMPPSVAVFGAYGRNDAVAQPFNAPAGYTRGRLGNVTDFAINLDKRSADSLYVARINPLLSKPGVGPVVWGQKTLLNKDSLLNRVNVRRLLIAIRREVRKVGNRFIFEPSREATLKSFNEAVQPILQRYQAAGGVEKYKVAIDTSTTSQADLDNKTVRGKIFIVPTTTIEFIGIDFVVTNRDNFVTG